MKRSQSIITGSRNARLEPLEPRTFFSGGLDPTFGTGGYVSTPAGPAQPRYYNSVSLLQGDGRLLIAADESLASGQRLDVLRFLANGRLDPSFGINGKLFLAAGIVPVAIAESAGGKIAIAGTSLQHVVFQLDANGKLDPTFGQNGEASLPDTFFPDALSFDGNQILVGGGTSGNTPEADLIRLTAAGNVEPTFGTNGIVSFIDGDRTTKVFVTPAGELLVATTANLGDGSTDTIHLLHTNGSVDSSFGSNGIYSTALPLKLDAVAPNGALLISNTVAVDNFRQVTFKVSRLKSNGSPDPSFLPVTTMNRDLAVEQDASVLLGGYYSNTLPSAYAVIHYSSTGVAGAVSTSLVPFNTANNVHIIPTSSGGYLVSGDAGNTVAGVAAIKLTATGTLDASFGIGGVLDSLSVATVPFRFQAVVVQTNRKVIAAGISVDGGEAFYLTRYNVDGSVDESFGSAGVVRTAFIGMDAQNVSLRLMPDGKLVAAGSVGNTATTGLPANAFAVVRYNTNGTLDPTFGKSGIVLIQNDSGSTAPYTGSGPSLLVQKGKLLIGTEKTLYRLNANGSVDPSFKLGPLFAGGNSEGASFGVQPDGKIVVDTYFSDSDLGGTFTAEYRYNLNGAADTKFGVGGKVISGALFLPVIPDQILAEPGGTILLVETVLLPGTQFSGVVQVIALNPDGSIRTQFGSQGTVSSRTSLAFVAPTLLQQPDGKLLLTTTNGQFDGPASVGGDTTLVTRFSATGQLDKTFGTGGSVSVGPTLPVMGRAGRTPTVDSIAALDSSGRLLLTGGFSFETANVVAVDTNNDAGTITGSMFYDTNGNGKRDAGDHPLNWTCYVDVDNDGKYDNADLKVSTNAAGEFTIPNLAPGVYHVRQSQVSHWQKTTPAGYTITVAAGKTVTGVSFGSRQIS